MKEQKPYNIQKVNDLNTLVIYKDYSRLEELLPYLSIDLSKKSIKGEVIFDLLLSNGNNSSRFFTMFFDGQTFKFKTLRNLTDPDNTILNKTNLFIKKNKDILKNGVLTQNEIERILNVIN